MQRRKPVVVGDSRPRPGANQQIGDGEIVDMSRPMKRGRAIALRRIHVDALLDERAHGCGVLAANSFDETRIGTSGAERRLRERSTIRIVRQTHHNDNIFASTRPLLSPNLSMTMPK